MKYYDAMYFHDGKNLSVEYEYDGNGNMTKDLNKNISSIQYNLLNLPMKISMNNSGEIKYMYGSDGVKLQEDYRFGQQLGPGTLSGGGSASLNGIGDEIGQEVLNLATDYCENIVYYRGNLKYALFDGGYATYSTNNTPQYFFYLKDHLGNNRLVISSDGVIKQTNHFYPYGSRMYESSNSTIQPYKYNGKELLRNEGIDWYDYGARQYDPVLLRFNTMDPLCEKYYNVSPYAYCGNNPVNAVDPDGKDYWSTTDKEQIKSFINALGQGASQFDFSGWNHYTDNEFLSNLYYNDETGYVYTNKAQIVDGEVVVTGTRLYAGITPVSFSGYGYEGAFVYQPLRTPLLLLSHFLYGTQYDDGIFKWDVNIDGRITGIAPIIGMPPAVGKNLKGGKEKMGHAIGNMSGNRIIQDKQIRSLESKYNLTKEEMRILHDEISHQGYGYHEIEELIKELFNR